MTDQINFKIENHIGFITLNRPDKLNAFTTEMLHSWADALTECATNDDVRVIVLTGSGRGFCSGGDINSFRENEGNNAYARKKSLADRVHQIPLIMDTLDKPVIVAVNGVATGAGMDMALMGDIRIAARSARFAESYIRVGIFAGDGGTWYLPRLVGTPKALELLWTGRFVEAEEAYEIGIVNQVVDDAELMEATKAMAQKIAAQPPIAVRMMKRAVYQGLRMDLRTHLDMASSHMATIYSTDDHSEALSALKDKRQGHFKGQ